MRGVSHTVMKMSRDMELAVDSHVDSVSEEPVFTISMGTGFTSGGKASVNIETQPLTEPEFRVVLGQMEEGLKLGLRNAYGESTPPTREEQAVSLCTFGMNREQADYVLDRLYELHPLQAKDFTSNDLRIVCMTCNVMRHGFK